MLTQHIDNFLISCRADGLSEKTITWYCANLSAWRQFVGLQDWHDPNVTRQFIDGLQRRGDRYINHPKRKRSAGGLSVNTIRGYLRTLKRFFNWLVQEEVIVQNPLDRIRMPKKPVQIPRAIDSDDFEKMLAAVTSDRDRALLLVLRDTGCRAGEVRRMRIRDVDLDRGVIQVIGKGNQEGFVFIQPSTSAEIKKWLQSRGEITANDPLFVSRHGELKPQTINNLLRRIAKRARVQGRFNPHSLRHAFARDYLINGGDLASLSDLLRHRDIQTTKMYATFDSAHLKELHSKHSPVR